METSEVVAVGKNGKEGEINQEAWEKIVNIALACDPDATGTLFNKYLRPRLYALATKKLKNAEQAKDVVQDIFVSVFGAHFMLTKAVIKRFQYENIPAEMVEALEPLRDKKFAMQDDFLGAIEELIGSEQLKEYQERIITYSYSRHKGRIRKRSLAGITSLSMTMIRNACTDFWKLQKSTVAVRDEDQSEESAAKQIAGKDIASIISGVLEEECTIQERELFEMRMVRELPWKEISAITTQKIPRLHYQLQKILEKLKHNPDLRAYWDDK